MIGAPIPDPRRALADNLNRQIDRFFAAGGKVQPIPIGVGVDTPTNGIGGHHQRLRAQRDKDAPKVRKMAEAGHTAAATARLLSMNVKRALLIAQENGFRFSEQ